MVFSFLFVFFWSGFFCCSVFPGAIIQGREKSAKNGKSNRETTGRQEKKTPEKKISECKKQVFGVQERSFY